MRRTRDALVTKIRGRLAAAASPGGAVLGDLALGEEADAELGALLQAADTSTDMEARHVAGMLCVARAIADSGERPGVHGSMAGTLMFPVWVLDPGSVPPELASGFAALDRSTHPDPMHADGPIEWNAQCRAMMVASGADDAGIRAKDPDELQALHTLAAMFEATSPPETRMPVGVGCGLLSLLATPPHHPDYLPRRADLLQALSMASLSWDLPGADRDPLDLAAESILEMSQGSPEREIARLELAARHRERYLTEQDPADLAVAVEIGRQAVAELGPSSQYSSRARSELGQSLVFHLQRLGGSVEEYDEMVGLFRAVVPRTSDATLNLGRALLLRYQRAEQGQDLDEAIRILESSPANPVETPLGMLVLKNLADALRARYGVSGVRADLEASIRYCQTILDASDASADHAKAAELAHGGLAMGLYNRFMLSGASADLRQAELHQRRAVELTPPGHGDRPGSLNMLTLILTELFEQTGQPSYINDSVDFAREAVTTTPEGHDVRSLRLLNLGTALGLRYRLTEDMEDLAQAHACRKAALESPALGVRHRAGLEGATGLSLLSGAARSSDPAAAVTEALAHFRKALALTPPDDPHYNNRRVNVAMAAASLAGQTGRPEHALEARRMVEALLDDLTPDSPQLPNVLSLAAATRQVTPRSLWSSRPRKEAIDLYRRAVAATPTAHANITGRLNSLAEALRSPSPMRKVPRADLVEAAEVFEQAATYAPGPPSERLAAARSWGEVRVDLGDWERALEGYVTAVELLGSVAPRHLGRDDQEYVLGQVVGLGADAAACAVRCGQPGLGVRLLERAKGVLLSHAFDTDSDLAALREVAPELADHFGDLRSRMDQVTKSYDLAPERSGEVDLSDARSDERQALAAEWFQVVRRIATEHPDRDPLRSVRDWDDSELCSLAEHGPVVVVNISRHGSDALIITTGGIESIRLAEADLDRVVALRTAFDCALQAIRERESMAASREAEQVVRSSMASLWDWITWPVLRQLGLTPASGDRPHLWWSPSGTLGALPIHAAEPLDGAPGALDYAVHSYTPTLRTLHRARERAATPLPPTALAVSVSQVPGLADTLLYADDEVAHLADLLPDLDTLTGEAATREAVLAALHDHTIAHFACHAISDLDHPSASGLVLHDHQSGNLSLRDLARTRHPEARLAYLSACHTLRTSTDLADESVHVVGAFQIVGFPDVIGTLWEVDDQIGMGIARDFYDSYLDSRRSPAARTAAVALHHAVRKVRVQYPQTPSLWACHIHSGY